MGFVLKPVSLIDASWEQRMGISISSYKEQDMSVSWYNAVGIGLDISGIIFIWMFSKKSPGMLTPEAIKLSRHVWWIEIGIFFIALGVTVQLLGYFLS
jgi:hypothetical protein